MNLAPGTLRKEGPGLDLPVAMGVLAATAQVPAAGLEGWAFAGELSLQGGLVSTPGVLSVAIAAARAGLRGVVVPASNAAEAALVDDLEIVGAGSLGRWSGSCEGLAADRARGDGPARGRGLRSISPRSEVRPRPAGRSRWRPPADTTSSWSDHPVRGQDDARAPAPHDLADDVA